MSQGPSGPLSGERGPSGPLSGERGPSGPLSGERGPSGPLDDRHHRGISPPTADNRQQGVAVTSLGPASVRFTGRQDGDMGHGGEYVFEVKPPVAARRRAVVDLPWTWLRQVHGSDVVHVRSPGDCAGSRADAAVTDSPGCALAVLAADCAPVALASTEGVVGVAHAGWMGLMAGVLERTVERMRALGATEVRAVLGPCIRPGCYEFGAEPLDRLAARLGEGVRGVTAMGTPALDVPRAVRAALAGVGVAEVADTEECTACDPGYFSWRARREPERQAVVAWR